jgi:hypothetical protein
VVLAFLLPLFVAGGYWAMRRGIAVRRAWLLPAVAAAALAASAWLAVETGEAQGERVERVVSERAIDTHEDVAEAFLTASAAVALIAAAGLFGGIAGRVARLATVAGSLVLVGMVIRVGHTGGQLVYRYGAANAYTRPEAGAGAGAGVTDSSQAAAVASGRRDARRLGGGRENR